MNIEHAMSLYGIERLPWLLQLDYVDTVGKDIVLALG